MTKQELQAQPQIMEQRLKETEKERDQAKLKLQEIRDKILEIAEYSALLPPKSIQSKVDPYSASIPLSPMDLAQPGYHNIDYYKVEMMPLKVALQTYSPVIKKALHVKIGFGDKYFYYVSQATLEHMPLTIKDFYIKEFLDKLDQLILELGSNQKGVVPCAY